MAHIQEIELKILNIDKSKITNKLISIGAKRVSKVLLVDKKFDFTDKRLTKNNKALRLRKSGNNIITFKYSKKNDSKFLIHEELETQVNDYNVMENIIKKLGLKIIVNREKKRTSFTLGKLKFEIDENPNIPPYLEIEGTKKDVIKAVKLLGFTMKDTTNMTTSQVLKQYKQNPDFIKF